MAAHLVPRLIVRKWNRLQEKDSHLHNLVSALARP